ncbi:MAG: carbon-monoxide dehydrogenase, catalytic subunit [Dehalococcoidia bacterium]|nr:carbon-monoxide dehydrogenase, catalytic subunit [Dehalococcoidia bacterium]
MTQRKRQAPQSIDPAAIEMLELAEAEGFSTAFSRAKAMAPCPIGVDGLCCRMCFMGPCRFVPKRGQSIEDVTGVCGATAATIVARNFARMVAAGASAHSDHGRDMAFVLLAAAKGEARGFSIRDEGKLRKVAHLMGIEDKGRPVAEVAQEVAEKALSNFGQQTGEITYASRAPKRRQELWRRLNLVPRGIDREIVETLHRTGMGTDQDPEHILHHTLRASMTDGWGGSMLATDISDILFGTPKPRTSQANLGVLKADQVNLVIHGHDPTLSEQITEAIREPELIQYAMSKGAKGINLAGICCTSNEVLMRQGVPSAGNMLHQELAILTGAVEAMVVDVQCTMEALVGAAAHFHTKVITTSPKAKIEGATHIEMEPHNAYQVARLIVRTAIDNYPNRPDSVHIPSQFSDLVAGFSHEYLRYMQGGTYRGSFRPLNDAIMSGRIRGAAGVVGCNNPRVTQDRGIMRLIQEYIKNDVLVVVTGCGAIAAGKHGYLVPEMMEQCGKGLREVCEAVGIPPVLHVGSCVDNSRILTVLTEMVEEGGLGDDISDLPAVGICPEWMNEKALTIATYFVASGAYVLFGVGSPVSGSPKVVELMTKGWEELVGGKLEFEPDIDKILQKSLAHIDAKRRALKLVTYDPNQYGQSGDRRLAGITA